MVEGSGCAWSGTNVSKVRLMVSFWAGGASDVFSSARMRRENQVRYDEHSKIISFISAHRKNLPAMFYGFPCATFVPDQETEFDNRY